MDGLSFNALADVPNGPLPKTLRDVIGPSKGRVSLEQHIQRMAFAFKHIPDSVWPSTAYLSDKYVGQTAIIVGGGSSLLDTHGELRAQLAGQRDKFKVFAPNKSHDFLINGLRDPNSRKKWIRKPIVPDFGVMVDPSDFVVTYQSPHPDVTYLFGTEVHHGVLTKFLRAKSKCYLWVPTYEGDGEDIAIAAKMFPGRPMHFVSGGSTIGLRTINLAAAMGFHTVDLYGYDSCYAPDPEGQANTKKLYAYEKPVIVHEVTDAVVCSKQTGHQFRFRSNSMMAKQAMEFGDAVQRLPEMVIDGKMRSVRLRVHGDGLIPWMAWKDGGPDKIIEHANPKAMYAKYGDAEAWDYPANRPCAKRSLDELRASTAKQVKERPAEKLTTLPVAIGGLQN